MPIITINTRDPLEIPKYLTVDTLGGQVFRFNIEQQDDDYNVIKSFDLILIRF